MLGKMLWDPNRVESDIGSIAGIGLLDFDVSFQSVKTVTQRIWKPTEDNPFKAAGNITGYEIHSGDVQYRGSKPLYQHDGGWDGAIHPQRPIFGTFIHDIFSNRLLTRAFINWLREGKALPPLKTELPDLRSEVEQQFQFLAKCLQDHTTFGEKISQMTE